MLTYLEIDRFDSHSENIGYNWGFGREAVEGIYFWAENSRLFQVNTLSLPSLLIVAIYFVGG
jgi:hypothetical protein